MKRGLRELEVEFEISMDLCRYKTPNRKISNIDEVIGHFGMPISEQYDYNRLCEVYFK